MKVLIVLKPCADIESLQRLAASSLMSLCRDWGRWRRRSKCPIFSSQLSSRTTHTSTTQKQEQLTPPHPPIHRSPSGAPPTDAVKRKWTIKNNNKNNKVMTGWQMNREKNKIKIKAAFRKETLRECRIIIIIILKWLLHFSLFLQTGAEFLWLPVGARVSLEQLHTMVTPDLVGKKSKRRNVSVI